MFGLKKYQTEMLFLFLILLFGLILSVFVNGWSWKTSYEGFTDGQTQQNRQSTSNEQRITNPNYDNYNHYTGQSGTLPSGAKFYSDNGKSANVITNSDGTKSLSIMLPGSTSPIVFSPNPPSQNQTNTPDTSTTTSSVESYVNYYERAGSASVFYDANGDEAVVIRDGNGQMAIRVTTDSGVYYYYIEQPQDMQYSPTQYYGSTGQMTGPNGGSAGAVTGPAGNTAYYAEGPNGNVAYGANGNINTTTNPTYSDAYATSITGPAGNSAYYAQGPNGNSVYGTTTGNGSTYYDSLPAGIPRSAIPPGQEDLYILKSEIVPPVCPVCPTVTAAAMEAKEEKCPPCPACARCPEPSFECKKVPNYNAINNDTLPVPVLGDFSQFGM